MSLEKNIERIADALEQIATLKKVLLPTKEEKQEEIEKEKAETIKKQEKVKIETVDRPEDKKTWTKEERQEMILQLNEKRIPFTTRQSSAVLAKKLEEARLLDKQEPEVEKVECDQNSPISEEQDNKGIEYIRRFIAMNIPKVGKDKANDQAREILKAYGATKVSELTTNRFNEFIANLKERGVAV